MMISKFNNITVSNNGNDYREFSFVEAEARKGKVRLLVEYLTGERTSICFRHYDETDKDGYFYPVIDIDWLNDDKHWWIEAVHQYTDTGYYHGIVATDGDNATVIAIIAPNNHMWVVGDEEIDLS